MHFIRIDSIPLCIYTLPYASFSILIHWCLSKQERELAKESPWILSPYEACLPFTYCTLQCYLRGAAALIVQWGKWGLDVSLVSRCSRVYSFISLALFKTNFHGQEKCSISPETEWKKETVWGTVNIMELSARCSSLLLLQQTEPILLKCSFTSFFITATFCSQVAQNHR